MNVNKLSKEEYNIIKEKVKKLPNYILKVRLIRQQLKYNLKNAILYLYKKEILKDNEK